MADILETLETKGSAIAAADTNWHLLIPRSYNRISYSLSYRYAGAPPQPANIILFVVEDDAEPDVVNFRPAVYMEFHGDRYEAMPVNREWKGNVWGKWSATNASTFVQIAAYYSRLRGQ